MSREAVRPQTGSRDACRARLRAAAALLLVAFAVLGATTARAAGSELEQARARYQRDRAACLAGETNQDRATCLREAGAAFEEAKRGGPADEDEKILEGNRVARCQPLPADEREDCIRRMRGEGTVSGSAQAGGIYRELRTVVPAPAAR